LFRRWLFHVLGHEPERKHGRQGRWNCHGAHRTHFGHAAERLVVGAAVRLVGVAVLACVVRVELVQPLALFLFVGVVVTLFANQLSDLRGNVRNTRTDLAFIKK